MEEYDRMIWYNNDIQFMFHNNILEYDMNAASLSLAERFKLLPKETIERLKRLDKKNRVIQTGLIRRDDKEFSVEVDKKLIYVRNEFIQENGILPNDLISLHSDAVIFASKKKIKDKIDGIQFKESNRSTGYMNYKKLEMFYNNDYITYKGASQQLLQQHTMGINKYLIKIFKYIEDYDPRVLKYMSRFQKQYLQDQFPEFMYTKFGSIGDFKYGNLDLFGFVAKVVIKEMGGW
jgi:hypothetical protein